MNTGYFISVFLNVSFREEYIKKILEIGAKNGCKYSTESTSALTHGYAKLSPQEAVQDMLRQWENRDIDHEGYACTGVNIHYKDTFFDLYMKKKGHYTYLWLDLDGTWWRDSSFIDYEPYIRLLFDMCKNIHIMSLKARDMGYDEEFYYYHKGRRCALREQADVTIVPDFKVDVTILPGWVADTFHNLLNHGAAADWHYYMPLQLGSNNTELSTEEAVAYILEQSPADKTEVSLLCIIGEIEHLLTFRLRFDTFFMFTLKPLVESVDLPRTVQHALDLCTDFCILELNTFDARYNYYKEPFDREKS